MSEARWLIGDVFERLTELPDASVHSVITSPPYWRKRRYLPADHPDAAKEIGQEPSPGAFLATLLRLTDELWRIVRDDGTIWINLGDTASGSGGAGGDYDEDGWREGQNRYAGTNRAVRDASPGTYNTADTPLRKSVCWIPELFGASLAYGRNLLTGHVRGEVSPPKSDVLGSTGARFVGGGPVRARLVIFRWLCGSASCSASLTVVSTSQALAWLGACRLGWSIGFDRGEATRLCPRCTRWAP